MTKRSGKFPDGAVYTELVDDNGKSVMVLMGKHSLKSMIAHREYSKKYNHLATEVK